jgi:hypothetical protein
MDEKPCCAAEALRRIRQVEISGRRVGIAMLDSVLAEVDAMNLSGEKETENELLKRIKIYNYVPRRAEEQYRIALLQEFKQSRERGA